VAEKPQHGPEVLEGIGGRGGNLIAAAIAGLVVAALWLGFDESGALLLSVSWFLGMRL
jgi:hypothetical protein